MGKTVAAVAAGVVLGAVVEDVAGDILDDSDALDDASQDIDDGESIISSPNPGDSTLENDSNLAVSSDTMTETQTYTGVGECLCHMLLIRSFNYLKMPAQPLYILVGSVILHPHVAVRLKVFTTSLHLVQILPDVKIALVQVNR